MPADRPSKSDELLLRIVEAMPEPLVRGIASRYVAGESLAHAITAARDLNAEGKLATLDILGEEVSTSPEAAAIKTAYLEAIAAIEAESVRANVSVKLTSLGLRLSYGICRENLQQLLRTGMFVRIDMEDSSTIDTTLKLFRELRETGSSNVGVVLQAYLRRTLADLRSIADLKPNVRLCKGIYNEPTHLRVGGREAVRTNYLRIFDELLHLGGDRVAVATHDEFLIREVLDRQAGRCEFQMLLGVREERASELASEGNQVRVYVPYGQDWYAYSMRRLHESPAVVRAVARANLSRLLRSPRAAFGQSVRSVNQDKNRARP